MQQDLGQSTPMNTHENALYEVAAAAVHWQQDYTLAQSVFYCSWGWVPCSWQPTRQSDTFDWRPKRCGCWNRWSILWHSNRTLTDTRDPLAQRLFDVIAAECYKRNRKASSRCPCPLLPSSNLTTNARATSIGWRRLLSSGDVDVLLLAWAPSWVWALLLVLVLEIGLGFATGTWRGRQLGQLGQIEHQPRYVVTSAGAIDCK